MDSTLINSKNFFEQNPTYLVKITNEPNIIADMNNKIVKRPVALLQEICSKLTIEPPVYVLVEMVGPPHEPIFVFRVSNYYRFGIEDGKGTSKASAKHAAALEVLLLFKRMTLNTKFCSDLDELM
jgi:dsRNA-specific ribonuclease